MQIGDLGSRLGPTPVNQGLVYVERGKMNASLKEKLTIRWMSYDSKKLIDTLIGQFPGLSPVIGFLKQ